MSTVEEFAPLILPVSSVTEGMDSVYKVITTTGEVVTVEANSAAEAMEKSGVVRPLRIISMAQEQRRLMERHVLHPEARSVATNIDMKNFVPDFRSLVVENLEEEEKPEFAECSLADIASRTLDKLPVKQPKPAPAKQRAQTPPPPPAPEPEVEFSPELIAVEKVPSEPEIIPPDRELTPEEVERLMNSKEA